MDIYHFFKLTLKKHLIFSDLSLLNYIINSVMCLFDDFLLKNYFFALLIRIIYKARLIIIKIKQFFLKIMF